jgi:hypothetical protein
VSWTVRGLIFLVSKTSRPASVSTLPPVHWVPVFLLRQKRLEREVNHSPSSSAKVKNEWSYTFTGLHGVDREKFTFFCVGKPGDTQGVGKLCYVRLGIMEAKVRDGVQCIRKPECTTGVCLVCCKKAAVWCVTQLLYQQCEACV